MATSKEVAAAAGVSVRTVSNVVNGFAHVAPDTRQRVLDAIEHLSYRPSELARSLKTGRSGLVGLMLPQLDNPYFAEITRELVEEGTRHGLTVVMDQTDGDHDRELEWIQRASGGSLFDALLLHPLSLRSIDLEVLPERTPVVFLGEHHYEGYDRVAVDSVAASRDAVLHLAETGRRRIAAIGVEADYQATSSQRLEGYRLGLQSAGLPEDPELLGPVAGFTRFEGHKAMTELLRQGIEIDAVYCFADSLALGALRSLREHGVRVPDDVAVVGIDDVEDGQFAPVSLSSIRPDKRMIARTTFSRLLERMDGKDLEPRTIIAPHELIARESTGFPCESPVQMTNILQTSGA